MPTASPSPNDDHLSRNLKLFALPSSFLNDSAFNIVPYFDFPGVIIVSVRDSDHDFRRNSGSRFERIREKKRERERPAVFLDNKRTSIFLNIPLKRSFIWRFAFCFAFFFLFPFFFPCSFLLLFAEALTSRF